MSGINDEMEVTNTYSYAVWPRTAVTKTTTGVQLEKERRLQQYRFFLRKIIFQKQDR